LKYEILIFSTFGAFVSIVLVEAVMAYSTVIQGYGSPLIIASMGATAVLIYHSIESPLSQPRNVIGGHIIAAITCCIITRLFRLSPQYSIATDVRPDEFQHTVWINAALSMSLSLFVHQLTGTVHPPFVLLQTLLRRFSGLRSLTHRLQSGCNGLDRSSVTRRRRSLLEIHIYCLSFRRKSMVGILSPGLCLSWPLQLLMVGWAMIINNVNYVLLLLCFGMN
jgi:HPP family